MRKIYLVADEHPSDELRGGQLNDAALLSYLNIPTSNYIHSYDLQEVNKEDFYIIGNFIGIKEEIKNKLSSIGNYIIYEKDYKFACVPGYPRHPLCWPNDMVPKDKIMWVNFYHGAKKVVCLTEWQKGHIDRNLNLGEKLVSIGGSIWSKEDLDLMEQLRENKKNEVYLIQSSPYKNFNESIQFCISNDLRYRILLPSNRKTYLENLSKHKGLVFFPVIPETCSRVMLETIMTGGRVITNEYSGAYQDGLLKLDSLNLINYIRNNVIPKAIEIFLKEIE